MSVNPIGGVSNISSLLPPTAAQTAATQATVPGSATATAAQVSPTVDAAQAWEEAMRAAMGDESSSGGSSSDPLSSLTTQTPAADPMAGLTGQAPAAGATTGLTAAGTATAAQTALTPEALAALISGSSTAPANPLITSLSAPSVGTTQPQPASAADSSSYA